MTCAEGKYTHLEGQFECELCPVGKYNDDEGLSGCEECSSGQYQDEMGKTDCKDCEAGTYTNDDVTKYTCAQCIGGYQSDTGQETCDDCPVGRFSNTVGALSADECQDCPIGKIIATPGQLICAECASSNQFQALEGFLSHSLSLFLSLSLSLSLLSSLRPSHILPVFIFFFFLYIRIIFVFLMIIFLLGQSECDLCPENSVAAGNHTYCECDFGYYAIPFGDYDLFQELDQAGYDAYNAEYIQGDAEFNPYELLGIWCVVCPEGADCFQTGTTIDNVEAAEGYFQGVDGTGTGFLLCLNEDACAADGCADGYTGDSCTECEQGLVMNDQFECKDCPSAGLILGILFAGFIAFVAVFVIKMQQVKKGGYTKTDIFSKIIVSSFQLNGLVLFFSFDWHAYMENYLVFQTTITSLGMAFLDLQCVGDTTVSSFVGNTVVWLFFPIFICTAIFIIVFFHGLSVNNQLGCSNKPIVKRVLKQTLDTVKGTFIPATPSKTP